jgi:hypothetical protein
VIPVELVPTIAGGDTSPAVVRVKVTRFDASRDLIIVTARIWGPRADR